MTQPLLNLKPTEAGAGVLEGHCSLSDLQPASAHASVVWHEDTLPVHSPTQPATVDKGLPAHALGPVHSPTA